MASPASQPYSLILTGSFGVGKTSLFRKLSGEVHAHYHFNNLQDQTRSKASHRFDKWTHTALVNGEQIKVTLWDTGNLERAGVGNITRSYFRQAVGVVLVYDIGNRDTLDALRNWVFYIKDNISWHQQQQITYVVWANNRDQTLTAVSEEQLNSFLTFLELSEDHYFDVNAYTGDNVFESYQWLIQKVHVGFSPHRNGGSTNDPISLDGTTQEKSSCSC